MFFRMIFRASKHSGFFSIIPFYFASCVKLWSNNDRGQTASNAPVQLQEGKYFISIGVNCQAPGPANEPEDQILSKD
jgi:hypothetical protein